MTALLIEILKLQMNGRSLRHVQLLEIVKGNFANLSKRNRVHQVMQLRTNYDILFHIPKTAQSQILSWIDDNHQCKFYWDAKIVFKYFDIYFESIQSLTFLQKF